MRNYTKWRKTWYQIIPGNFNGDPITDLLFYDKSKGEGEFYSIGSNVSTNLLKKSAKWRKTWYQIL